MALIEVATLSKLRPYLDSRATLDLQMTHAYSKILIADIDQSYFQPNNTISKHKVLRENDVARNEAIPNGEAQIKHAFSKYTDDGKRWLVTTADEKRSKRTGFMLSLKRR